MHKHYICIAKHLKGIEQIDEARETKKDRSHSILFEFVCTKNEAATAKKICSSTDTLSRTYICE